MQSPREIVRAITGLFVIFTCYCVFIGHGIFSAPSPRLRIARTASTTRTARIEPSPALALPNKIWQKWEVPAQDLGYELQELSLTWTDLNPSFRYELLTSESSLTFVEEHFKYRPDIVKAFAAVEDEVVRADLIRYLVLLAVGGVYADIDTHCTKPIDEWIPRKYRSRTMLAIGVEYDSQGGEITEGFSTPVQLCQWTIWARPGSKAMLNIVNRVFEKLAEMEEDPFVDMSYLRISEIMEMTGPWIFTTSVMEAAGITYDEITNLTAPQLFGEVLILPVAAFASDQEHSSSGRYGNDDQLMQHHFFGFDGWKQTHDP